MHYLRDMHARIDFMSGSLGDLLCAKRVHYLRDMHARIDFMSQSLGDLLCA